MVVDGMPVAASLNCLVGRRYAGYIVGFAREWSRYGVGRLLLSHVIQDAIDEGAREFDLAAGAQEYKARFATHQSEVVNVTLVLSRRPRHLAMVAEGYARQGKDRFIAFSTSARASIRNLVGHRT
jgi:CelD/BcsL family acetyltransferase involved in cellulose biosynthesis